MGDFDRVIACALAVLLALVALYMVGKGWMILAGV